MSAHREEIRKRDERMAALGYVPREIERDNAQGSIARLRHLLELKSHGAALKRIVGFPGDKAR